MKYSVVLPLVATVVGFCLGWLVKPQSEPVITQRPLATSQTPKAPAKPALEPPVQPPPGPALRPGAAGKPDAEFREKAGTARNSAKMLRFAEALGPLAPSAQSIQTLRQLADGQPPEDPSALHAKLIASQQRQTDARLTLLKDILTSAQFTQFQTSVGEQDAIRDVMSPPHW